VAYNLFQRRGRSDGAVTQFAETELSRPAPADSLPPGADASSSQIDSLPAGPNTDLGLDTRPAPAAEWAVAASPTTAHIGRYALKSLLGSGSQGQVHEAWDPLLSRTVAVKTLLRAPDTPRRAALDALWLKAARAAAGLSHPCIVTVHDAGLSAQGVYVAMERLRGSSLRQRLAEGWQPQPAQAALLVRRLADALAYAHGLGVLHGGVQPGSIFLNRRDQPKLLDFGIARAALRAQRLALDTAEDGPAQGMSPGPGPGPGPAPAGRLDASIDVRALGAVLHQLLALRADAPRGLTDIATRATAADAAEGYATALELAHALRRWIERDKATQPQQLESARPRARAPGQRQPRHPGLRLRTVLGVTVLVLLVCAGTALALRGRMPAGEHLRRGQAAAAPLPPGMPVAP
jgi:serine/threonine-protein kinase